MLREPPNFETQGMERDPRVLGRQGKSSQVRGTFYSMLGCPTSTYEYLLTQAGMIAGQQWRLIGNVSLIKDSSGLAHDTVFHRRAVGKDFEERDPRSPILPRASEVHSYIKNHVCNKYTH